MQTTLTRKIPLSQRFAAQAKGNEKSQAQYIEEKKETLPMNEEEEKSFTPIYFKKQTLAFEFGRKNGHTFFFKRGSYEYASAPSLSHFLEYYNTLEQKDKNFYELLPANTPMKMFCDIEGVVTLSKMEVLKLLLRTIVTQVFSDLGMGEYNEKYENITESDGNKMSFHYDYFDGKHVFRNNDEQKKFWQEVDRRIESNHAVLQYFYEREDGKLEPRTVVDLGVYSKNRAMRMVFSGKKNGNDRPLKPVALRGNEIVPLELEDDEIPEYFINIDKDVVEELKFYNLPVEVLERKREKAMIMTKKEAEKVILENIPNVKIGEWVGRRCQLLNDGDRICVINRELNETDNSFVIWGRDKFLFGCHDEQCHGEYKTFGRVPEKKSRVSRIKKLSAMVTRADDKVELVESKTQKEKDKEDQKDTKDQKAPASLENESLRKLLEDDFEEYAFAKQFVALYGKEFIFYDKILYHFNGSYWRPGSEAIISTYLSENFRNLLLDTMNQLAKESIKLDIVKASASIKKLGRTASKKAIVEEIEKMISISDNPFDKNKMLLGFEDGTYDLEKGVFRAGSRDDFISMTTRYRYSELKEIKESEEKVLNDFLEQIYPDQKIRNDALLMFSTALCGNLIEKWFILTGSGRNGKDTIINYMDKALGDYAYKANTLTITQKQKSESSESKAQMNNKRFVYFSEPDAGSNLVCSELKDIRGGAKVSARGLYSKNCHVNMHATLLILANEIPKLDKVDEAIANSLVVIPHVAMFRGKDVIGDYPEDTPHLYAVDTKFKDTSFINRMSLVMMKLLLSKFNEFKEAKYQYIPTSEEILRENKRYLSISDELYQWFIDRYQKTDDKKAVLRMTDIYNDYKASDLYANLDKKTKRLTTKDYLKGKISMNPNLRAFFRERAKIDGTFYRSVMIGFTTRNITESDENEENQKDEKDEDVGTPEDPIGDKGENQIIDAYFPRAL